MPMSPRLLRPRASGLVATDPDARTYISAVQIADASSLEPAVQRAINDFVIGCKADNIWTAIKASCILMGAKTLSGALTPLVGGSPTNASNNFVSGDYNRKTGLVGNGTNKSIATNYTLTGALQNNRHGAVYVSTAQTSGNHAYFGSSSAAFATVGRTQLLAADGAEGNLISRCADETSNASGTANNVAGLQGISRSASGSYVRRANATNQTVSVSSLSGDDSSMSVFSRNVSGSTLHTSGRLAYYSFGESLDLALLDTRLTALYNAIGAAVP
jgi:hypothetical protein